MGNLDKSYVKRLNELVKEKRGNVPISYKLGPDKYVLQFLYDTHKSLVKFLEAKMEDDKSNMNSMYEINTNRDSFLHEIIEVFNVDGVDMAMLQGNSVFVKNAIAAVHDKIKKISRVDISKEIPSINIERAHENTMVALGESIDLTIKVQVGIARVKDNLKKLIQYIIPDVPLSDIIEIRHLSRVASKLYGSSAKREDIATKLKKDIKTGYRDIIISALLTSSIEDKKFFGLLNMVRRSINKGGIPDNGRLTAAEKRFLVDKVDFKHKKVERDLDADQSKHKKEHNNMMKSANLAIMTVYNVKDKKIDFNKKAYDKYVKKVLNISDIGELVDLAEARPVTTDNIILSKLAIVKLRTYITSMTTNRVVDNRIDKMVVKTIEEHNNKYVRKLRGGGFIWHPGFSNNSISVEDAMASEYGIELDSNKARSKAFEKITLKFARKGKVEDLYGSSAKISVTDDELVEIKELLSNYSKFIKNGGFKDIEGTINAVKDIVEKFNTDLDVESIIYDNLFNTETNTFNSSDDISIAIYKNLRDIIRNNIRKDQKSLKEKRDKDISNSKADIVNILKAYDRDDKILRDSFVEITDKLKSSIKDILDMNRFNSVKEIQGAMYEDGSKFYKKMEIIIATAYREYSTDMIRFDMVGLKTGYNENSTADRFGIHVHLYLLVPDGKGGFIRVRVEHQFLAQTFESEKIEEDDHTNYDKSKMRKLLREMGLTSIESATDLMLEYDRIIINKIPVHHYDGRFNNIITQGNKNRYYSKLPDEEHNLNIINDRINFILRTKSKFQSIKHIKSKENYIVIYQDDKTMPFHKASLNINSMFYIVTDGVYRKIEDISKYMNENNISDIKMMLTNNKKDIKQKKALNSKCEKMKFTIKENEPANIDDLEKTLKNNDMRSALLTMLGKIITEPYYTRMYMRKKYNKDMRTYNLNVGNINDILESDKENPDIDRIDVVRNRKVGKDKNSVKSASGTYLIGQVFQENAYRALLRVRDIGANLLKKQESQSSCNYCFTKDDLTNIEKRIEFVEFYLSNEFVNKVKQSS